MQVPSLTITTLHHLLDYEICKDFQTEMHLKESLPRWITLAGSLSLKTVLGKYLEYVEEHLKKIENFINEEKTNALNIRSRVIETFVAEADDVLGNCTETQVKDACLLARVQEINHFKICSYGTAAAFANAIELKKTATLFHEAEVNEKEIDQRLSKLAESEINVRAKTPIVLGV